MLRVWDVAAGKEAGVLAGHRRPVVACALSADGRLALSGSSDGTARVWDIAAGREVARLDGHDGAVKSVAFTPDGARAVTAGNDGTLRVWRLDVSNSDVAAVEGRRKPAGGAKQR